METGVSDEDLVGKLLKKHIRLGINSVARTLENEPSNILFVLVCRSCMPLNILTRHIQIMCSTNNIPAGCINDLSSNLSKIFKINKISCIAICKFAISVDCLPNINENIVKNVGLILEDLSSKITCQLPTLPNLFSENILKSQELEMKIRDFKEIMDQIEYKDKEKSDENKSETSNKTDKFNQSHDTPQDFGSDFITFKDTSELDDEIDFDSNNFIIFNDLIYLDA